MVATCALFFSACSNVESDGAYADQTGSISIDLGSSTRGLVTFDSTTVTWYKLEVTGNGKTYKDEGAPGSKIKFENLSIGVYTVLCEAYMGEAKIQIATAEANVVAGETADVVLKFKKENLLSTKFVMIYKDKRKIYDDVKDIPSDFKIDGNIADFKSISYAEDKNGDIYYITGDETYFLKCINNPEFEIEIEDHGFSSTLYLYYDALSEVLYMFEYYDSNGFLYKVDVDGNATEFVAALNSGSLSTRKGFCVEGNKFFLYGEEEEYPEGEQMNFCAIYYGTIDVEEKSITQVSKMKVNDIFGDQYKNAQITDMVIIGKGKILMLLSQNLPSLMSNGQITIDNYTGMGSIYSRGAIAELSYDDKVFNKTRVGGWFDDSKKRTLTQNGENPLSGNKETLKNVDIYGPSKAQRKDYFCGPKRIVCIRPKEVYIVDEGVNIRLADWTKRHDGCRDYESDVALGQYDPDGVSYGHIGRSGNLFRVSRIVKVNLDTFAMNTEKEAVVPLFKISATETGGQARYSSSFNSNDFIFSSISVSGSSDNLGYVECLITGYLGIHPFMEEDEN